MINLDDGNIQTYSMNYYDKMKGKGKLLNEYDLLDRTADNLLNGKKMIDFLGDTKAKFKSLVKELLISRIDIIRKNYAEINLYMMSAEFCQSANSDMKVELHNIKRGNLREKARRHFIESRISTEYGENTWLKNHWLNSSLSKVCKSDDELKIFIQKFTEKFNKLNNFVKKIFFYDQLENVDKNLRHEILLQLDINVCPYCNRNYISKFKKNGELKSSADLDHFYNKDKFTLFSLSLYNFVPSCQICNSRLKGTKIKGIFHPYTQKIDYSDFCFKLMIEKDADLSLFFGGNVEGLKINIVHNEKYKDHIETFQLDSLYNIHKNVAVEVLLKKQTYNQSYGHLMDKIFSDLNFNETQKNLFLYGVDLEQSNFHERPLSKFVFDLMDPL
ncbi:hypothetical protein [Exiguobacterium sp. s193]|uniref:hypothetical protein n=1 Tax=Exiguobacterium sp. s193 TaxID=2751207 RepID=UPI001BEB2DFF|nr:hypothetical protein [Exiguobacterium sp. s193]